MKPIPSNRLWNDVLPRDPAWGQFIWQIALTTIPFILIAIFALIFDWMTRFPSLHNRDSTVFGPLSRHMPVWNFTKSDLADPMDHRLDCLSDAGAG